MEPESIRVQGPEKTLAQLDSIDTKSQTLDNEKFPVHKEFSLVQPNNKQITLLDSKVTIAADIQQLLEKVIPQVPVTVRYLPQNIEALIHPPHISVTIQGGMHIISRLKENDINAYVEYQAGSDSLLTSVPILIEPIAGVSIREKSSERVKITFLRNTEQ
jgi:hypothetical protein